MVDSKPMPPRLLLAEDDLSVQRVASRMIERLGWTVEVTESGVDAVKAALASPFDAILLDLGLQDIDGAEVARRVRLGEDGRHTPLIAITGDSSPEARARCLEAGMDDYIAKPMSLSALRTALSPWGSTHDRKKVPSGELRGVSRMESLSSRVLMEAANGDLRVARELAKAFLRDAQRCVLQLRDAAIAQNDVERARLAHKLKGASSMIGATRLTLLADDLETRALEGAPALVGKLGEELVRVEEAMMSFTEPRPPTRL